MALSYSLRESKALVEIFQKQILQFVAKTWMKGVSTKNFKTAGPWQI